MIIRDAVEADLPAIVEIYNATVPSRLSTGDLEAVSVESRLPWFREHSPGWHPFWVMEGNGTVAAWLSFQSFHGRCAYRGTAEVSVYVQDRFRRQGIARRLLEAAIERSPSLGLEVLLALVFGHNEASLQLFSGLGFQRWGHLPRIARLDDRERDLIIMGLRPGAAAATEKQTR